MICLPIGTACSPMRMPSRPTSATNGGAGEQAELGGRRRKWQSTKINDLGSECRIVERGINLPVQFVDDFDRCVLRRANSLPAACFITTASGLPISA
jgi:hypothetical protein